MQCMPVQSNSKCGFLYSAFFFSFKFCPHKKVNLLPCEVVPAKLPMLVNLQIVQ